MTLVHTEFENSPIDDQLNFFGGGIHVTAGGGAAFPVSRGVQLTAGLFYTRHTIFEANADGNVNGVDYNVEFEDVVVDYAQFRFGALF